MTRFGRALALVTVVSLSLIAQASGQEEHATSRPGGTTSAPASSRSAETRPILAGPIVESGAMDDEVTRFNSRRRASSVHPMSVWLQSLQSMPLSLEQRSTIDSLAKELQQRRARFNREHGREFKSLREVVQRNVREKIDTDRQELVRFEELRSKVPDMVQCQIRIWKTLRTSQQQRLRTLLIETQQKNSDRRPSSGR